MAKTSWNDYSASAASNTDIDSIDISEGCAPSGINNAIREIMAHTADVVAGTTAVTTFKTSGDLTVGDDLLLNSDDAVISFGADADIKIIHHPDNGLFLKSTATGDDTPFILTLQTGDTDIATGDQLGIINFQAPDEATGGDAVLAAAGIEAVSEGDFSATANATSLLLKTASDAAATEKVKITSAGFVGINNTAPTSRLSLGDSTANTNNTITFGKRVSSSQSNLPLIGHDSSDGAASDLGICSTSSSGKINFYTGNDASGFGTGSNELRMQIDSSGYVTKAKVPAFYVYSSNTTSTNFKTDGQHIIGKTADFNTVSEFTDSLNNFNTTNGYFTAPVAGLYYFNAHVTPYNTGGNPRGFIGIYKNGTGVGPVAYYYNLNYNGTGASVVLALAESDYVYAAGVGTNSISTTVANATFAGHFLG